MIRPETLADFQGDYRISGTQRNYENCPGCGSTGRKLYVDPVTGTWFCFAGKHHAGGKVDVGLDDRSPGSDLLSMLEPDTEEVTWSETELPPWHEVELGAYTYLGGRGVTAVERSVNGIVEWTGQSRILFPYFRNGELIFWSSRTYLEDDYRSKYLHQPGKKPLYSPVTICPRYPGTLVVVEGVMDALAVARAGFGVVALGGKSLPGYLVNDLLTRAENCGIINVLLDGDALAEAVKIHDTLASRTTADVVIICIPEDPGVMSVEELTDWLI